MLVFIVLGWTQGGDWNPWNNTTKPDLYDMTRSTAAITAILGAAVGLALALRKQRATEQNTAIALERHQQDTISSLRDRYTTAAQQLGDDASAVRLAGVYAMSALADDWAALDEADETQTCIDVLCAYLRTPRQHPPSDPGLGPEHLHEARGFAAAADREVRQTIVRTISSHLQPSAAKHWRGHNLDLTNTTFDFDIDFDDAVFSGQNTVFNGATFSGNTAFNGATFSGNTAFNGATFSGAFTQFKRAIFSGENTRFVGATFSGKYTWFHRATFSGTPPRSPRRPSQGKNILFVETTFSGMVTQFVRATFSGERTSFRQATFSSIHTVFQRATFSGKNAVFEGATFSGGSAVFKLATFSGENTSFMEVTFSGDAHIDFRNAQRPSLPGRTAVPAVLGPGRATSSRRDGRLPRAVAARSTLWGCLCRRRPVLGALQIWSPSRVIGL